MDTWNSSQYLRFSDERTRPSIDLALRIKVESPTLVVDLGCGPGNSTAILKQRWPEARVIGLDSSQGMIETARSKHPDWEWTLSGIEDWRPEQLFDVVFSNAALQWLPGHEVLIRRLYERVATGGALAFQIPSATYALIRTIIHQIAIEGSWAPLMTEPLAALTMKPPEFYYDHLSPTARLVDAWETEYLHVMDSHAAIVEWISSTGLRPFLKVLETEFQQQEFVTQLLDRVRSAYDVRLDGKILFPFRRTFIVAYA